jgi:hypothetical protein
MFIVRKQPLISASIIALISGLIGVNTLFLGNTTFGATGSDWLGAFAWGVGFQLAGTTLAQMGTSLAAAGPKTT